MKTAFRAAFAALVCLALSAPIFSQQQSILSRVDEEFVASNYRFTTQIATGAGPYAAGTVSISIASGSITLPDGRTIIPFNVNAPITIGNGANAETLTPTAISGCTANGANGSCLVTVATVNTHGSGDPVTSGTAGLQEAIDDAFANGGGIVSIGPAWSVAGGTNALITAATPYASVSISDKRAFDAQYWRPTQNVTAALATPTVLNANATCTAGTTTVCSDANVASTFTNTAFYWCIAYVDIMGNESSCSTTANFTATLSKAIDVTAPAASTGAVGYTIYGGTSYAAAVELPITSAVCIMTKVETITPACAVTNTTYGQTNPGSTSQFGAASYNAQLTVIQVTTSPLALNATTTSSTTDYVGNPNARTVYLYAPSHRVGLGGIVAASQAFPVGAAAASTVPNVIGTLAIPPGYMNYVGREMEVCGFATEATAGSTSTVTTMQLWWDAAGSDTATGVPILIATIPVTVTLVTSNTDQYQFCFDLKTTVAGASATAGSILQTGGFFGAQYTASSVATLPKVVLNQGAAATGSLNLAGGAGFATRIHVVYLHSTGTDGAGVQLQDLTVKELN